MNRKDEYWDDIVPDERSWSNVNRDLKGGWFQAGLERVTEREVTLIVLGRKDSLWIDAESGDYSVRPRGVGHNVAKDRKRHGLPPVGLQYGREVAWNSRDGFCSGGHFVFALPGQDDVLVFVREDRRPTSEFCVKLAEKIEQAIKARNG